jgi:hypothetical protein
MNQQTDSLAKPEKTKVKKLWSTFFLTGIAWIMLALGLTGVTVTFYYFDVISFGEGLIIDPFGLIILFLSLIPVLLGFPLLLTLSKISKDLRFIRDSIKEEDVVE